MSHHHKGTSKTFLSRRDLITPSSLLNRTGPHSIRASKTEGKECEGKCSCILALCLQSGTHEWSQIVSDEDTGLKGRIWIT